MLTLYFAGFKDGASQVNHIKTLRRKLTSVAVNLFVKIYIYPFRVFKWNTKFKNVCRSARNIGVNYFKMVIIYCNINYLLTSNIVF